jgi:hypothetical protein
MLNANNPAVNLETRRFLRELVDDEFGLDEDCVVLLEQALDRVKAVSPSGWVFMLAQSLGAGHRDAIEAASFAEMYYAMCSFTDDVQDGDAREYMQGVDERILINTLAQLICVTIVRGGWFASRTGGDASTAVLTEAFLSGAVMLHGASGSRSCVRTGQSSSTVGSRSCPLDGSSTCTSGWPHSRQVFHRRLC